MSAGLTLETFQIQLEHWFCQRLISHYTQSRTFFYLWRSREWLTLSYVLEIVHYYDVCPFTIFFSWPSWSYGSWIYNYLCNQCLAFHHLSCDFEFWFSPDTPVSATNKTDLHDITEILLKVAFNTITLIQTIFSFLRLLR
jgi:hypothetical protein